MENNYLVCLICCKEFKGDCGEENFKGKEKKVESLKQFCEVILEVDKNEFEGNGSLLKCFHGKSNDVNGKEDGNDWDTSKGSVQFKFGGDSEENDVRQLNGKLSEFLRNPCDNLSICENCLDLMKMVTEARLSAKCVEESVEKLQMLLLRELRRLQGRLELFWGEFKKMEETLVNGDLKLIEIKLDGSYSQSYGGGKKKRRMTSKMTQEHVERKEEIFGFREKICQAFKDFHHFNKKLNDKIACNPINQPTRSNTITSSRKIYAQGPPEKKRKSTQEPQTDMKPRKDNNDKGLSYQLPSKMDEIVDAHLHDNDGNMDDESMHLDNFDDNDNFSEDNKDEIKPTDERASLRRRVTRKKYDLEPSDSDEVDGPQDSGEEDNAKYQPETSKQVKTILGDKRRCGTGRKQDKRKSAVSTNEDMEEQNRSEDDDDEYKPEDPEKLSKRAKIYRLLREYKPHLAQLSPFKRDVITSVIRCQFFNENQEKKKGADKLNVFQRHMTYLSYNLETQLISLKDVPIKIVCQVEKENEENGLVCMQCDLKVAECPKMENLMWEHVLSKHLNAYQCPHCKKKQYDNHAQYSQHTYKCLKRREQVERVECDICGKSLCNNKALQMHKWSHMSEEERKEALESGLVKKAPINKSTKGLEKKFQCEICGKSFVHKHTLESHEKIHQDRESREQFICPKCGKSFLKAGYNYHLKYGGSCGEDNPNVKKEETCVKCGKILKNKILLKRHLKEVHEEADLKPWICEICGKAFKKKDTLKLHETIHTGEKPWNCGRCGTAFSRQNNMKRHEATCGKWV